LSRLFATTDLSKLFSVNSMSFFLLVFSRVRSAAMPNGRCRMHGNSWDAAQLPETKGTVRQYTLTPRGDVDGFILTDGTKVYAVRPGNAVTVRGLKAFALPLIDAATITNDATGAMVVDNGPPCPDRWGLATTITGKVSATLHGPRGEINGALLENGTILRLGPREAAYQSALVQPGQSLAARGISTTTYHWGPLLPWARSPILLC
jgi:hypothetical protein